MSPIYLNNQIIDESICIKFKAPKSFTGEDTVEIYCHGSIFIQQQILNACVMAGARLAEPGEFTQRAFLNGKMDLTQAEAVADLIASENKASHQLAIGQLRGGLKTELELLREKMIDFTSLIELELDFGEEDVEFANRDQLLSMMIGIKNKVQSMVHSFAMGNAIKNGIPVAIIGKPNAGKSTLLNALLNEEKAIVSNIPGTTRDVIEDKLNIGALTFRFMDTAGLRDTNDEIEQIGVNRAKQKATEAMLIIYLFDPSQENIQEIITLENELKKEYPNAEVLMVINKMDLFNNEQTLTQISAKEKLGLDALQNTIVEKIQTKIGTENQQLISNTRHLNELQSTQTAIEMVLECLNQHETGDILSFHLREAITHIGNITGNINNEEVLGNIFSKFCIGK